MATTELDGFIALDRTFQEFTIEEGAGDDADLIRLVGRRDALRWPDLLREYRVILLSEAAACFKQLLLVQPGERSIAPGALLLARHRMPRTVHARAISAIEPSALKGRCARMYSRNSSRF